MAVAIPIITAVAGLGATAYSIISSENDKSDAKNGQDTARKSQQVETLKNELAQLEINQKTAELKYKKMNDEYVRKEKLRNTATAIVAFVLFSIGVLVSIKIVRNVNAKII